MEIKTEYSKGGNVVYTIDEENRVVFAELQCNELEAYQMLQSKLKKFVKGYQHLPPFTTIFESQNNKYFVDEYLLKERYIGKAQCHPDDVFDAEYGKRLALYRARIKYLYALNMSLGKMCKWIAEFSKVVKELNVSFYRKWTDCGMEEYNLLHDRS